MSTFFQLTSQVYVVAVYRKNWIPVNLFDGGNRQLANEKTPARHKSRRRFFKTSDGESSAFNIA